VELKREKCIIIGPSASGKDYLKRKLSKRGLKALVKYTTRPMREGEIDGVEYRFVSQETFHEMLKNSEFLLHQEFEVWPKDKEPEKWYYGISLEDFESSQVMILTPGEFLQVEGIDRKNYFVVLLDIPEEVRRQRLSVRNDNNDSIDRRISADREDFSVKIDYDLKISDPDFEEDMVWDLMY
jgi:guanylate kinase